MVVGLVLITLLYCWALLWLAWGFSRAGGVVGWGLAAAVAILLLLTVWVTWREVLFGLNAARLAREYSSDGASGPRGASAGDVDPVDQQSRQRDVVDPHAAEGLPAETGASEPSRAAPRAEFDLAKAAIEQGPGESDWQAWFRLSLAYDAVHDRRQARAAARHAIELYRAAR